MMDSISIKSLGAHTKIFDMKNISYQNSHIPVKNPTATDSFKISASTPASEDMKSNTGDDRLTAIINKMQAGQELSPDELKYLQEHSPQIYNDAVKLGREKKLYAESLGKCKTKEDARMLHMNKVVEAFHASDSLAAGSKLAAMTKVYTAFTATSAFAKLATNQLELIEALKAETKIRTDVKEAPPAEEKDDRIKAPEEEPIPNLPNVDHEVGDSKETSEIMPEPSVSPPQTAYAPPKIAYSPQGDYAYGNESSHSKIDVSI